MISDGKMNDMLKAQLVAYGTNWREVDIEADVRTWIAGPAGDTYEKLCKWNFDDTAPTPRRVIDAVFDVNKKPTGPWLLSGVIKRH